MLACSFLGISAFRVRVREYKEGVDLLWRSGLALSGAGVQGGCAVGHVVSLGDIVAVHGFF